jgi:CDGSH-type Zn-finger protein
MIHAPDGGAANWEGTTSPRAADCSSTPVRITASLRRCHNHGRISGAFTQLPVFFFFPRDTHHRLEVSLALLETRKVGGIQVMAQVKITVRPNGPYRVEAAEGSVELVDVNGNQFDLTGKPAFSLCRCGGSVNKPFCDGTHSRIGFQGAELAVKKAED